MPELTDIEMYLNPDPEVWAARFCRIAQVRGFDPTSDEHRQWVATWIANAMMHGVDRQSNNLLHMKARAEAEAREDAERAQ